MVTGMAAFQAISKLPKLTELDLSKNKVGNEGCREISKILSLKVLKLNDCRIGDIGASFVSQLKNLE